MTTQEPQATANGDNAATINTSPESSTPSPSSEKPAEEQVKITRGLVIATMIALVLGVGSGLIMSLLSLSK
ncbi:MAG: hypothetical protein MK135_02780 [Polyangiaceae bacterium]|nr:hypothetical protein [Polyangiaceae bacterium]